MMTHQQKGEFGKDDTAIPDLSPRPESVLEWWFVQGFLEGEKLGRREFMISMFRHKGAESQSDGHMLLLTSCDPKGSLHSVRSQVTPQLVENFSRDVPDEIRNLDIDQTVVDALLKEIAASGPPRPIQLETDEVVIAASPLSIEWKDFTFRDVGGNLELCFDLPENGSNCRLTATPIAAWFKGRDLGDGSLGTMDYDSCPRMKLTGTVEEEVVSGQAWVDHQWGGYGWMHAPSKGKEIFGWDWLGINLEDGCDLIIMVHRDMRTRKQVSQRAVIFDGHRGPQSVNDVTVTTLREWRSPETMIDYPVYCRIDIPSLELVLEFTPLVDHQEVPVFGLINAIWEGAGRITGAVGGRPVSGRARLELHGYGYVLDFADYQRKWVDRIDLNIAGFLPRELDQECLSGYLGPPRWGYDNVAQTDMLAQPVWDLLSRGGKHWRPIFGLLLLDALGVDIRPFEVMFSAIPELIHNGSVIIDDIEDSSLTRRGEETFHLKYGLPTAINAGNTLYFLPLTLIAKHPHLSTKQRDACYQAVVTMFVQAHFGQAQDLHWSKLDPSLCAKILDDEKTGPLILQAHAFKSAAAVRTIAEMACIVAEASPQTRESCLRLSESWGVAFQIVDDVNNFSTSQRWGKVRGEDVMEGKFNYVIHKAVRLLEGDGKKRLLAILTSKKRRRSKAGLLEAIDLIESSGAPDACRREATDLVAQDWPIFSKTIPGSHAKFMLRALLAILLGTPFEM